MNDTQKTVSFSKIRKLELITIKTLHIFDIPLKISADNKVVYRFRILSVLDTTNGEHDTITCEGILIDFKEKKQVKAQIEAALNCKHLIVIDKKTQKGYFKMA